MSNQSTEIRLVFIQMKAKVKKYFYPLLLLVLCAFLQSKAQRDSVFYGNRPVNPKLEARANPEYQPWKEKVTYGGNFQVWLGTSSFVYLAPSVGFIPVKNLNVGVGFIYNYTSMQSYYGNYSQSIFGGHSFIRYTIADAYFLQMQFDKLRQPNLYSIHSEDKIWIDYYLLGGGFRRPIGDKAALLTSIMYNLKPDPLSIYYNRFIIQFGIVANL